MARAVTLERDLPATALPVAERIRLLGFGWRYFPEHKLADMSKRLQVRDIAAVAPPREIAKYAAGLKRGDVMPPVVMTRDGYLIDGATRTEAARRLGWNCYPTFELDTNYEDAPEAMVQQLVVLGSAFNLIHGRGMSMANIDRVVAMVASEDDSPREIARKLHISESRAAMVINAGRARSRAARLGVELDGTLTNSHLKMLGGKSDKYTDPIFAGLVTLVQEARLSTPATADLCKRIEATGTEAERMKILQAERASYADVISGGATQPSRAARLRRSLGFVIGQDNPELLVELNPSAAANHDRALRLAITKLQNILVAQQRMSLARRG